MENDRKIKCPNCLAEFNVGEIRCPHCGFQNDYQAKRAFDSKMEVIEEEREEIISWPKRVILFLGKHILLIVIAVILVILITVGAAFAIYSGLKAKGLDDEKNAKARMEECIENNDYDQLAKEFETVDENDVAYAKYREINTLYSNYTSFVAYCEQVDPNFSKQNSAKLQMGDVCKGYYTFMMNYNGCINDSKHLGNEDDFEYIFNMLKTYVDEKVSFMTYEDLEEMYNGASQSDGYTVFISDWCADFVKGKMKEE